MSRVGKQPISIPSGVTVGISGNDVVVKGAKGELSWSHPAVVTVRQEGDEVHVTRENDLKPSRAFHGLTRSLIANMVHGVSTGYRKELTLEGVGFRASVQGRKLVLALGYSHPIEYTPPDGVTATAPDATTIVVEGADKQGVGQAAARIRSFYPAEPYKGKGVRYKDEQIRRKAGKTVA